MYAHQDRIDKTTQLVKISNTNVQLVYKT